MNEGPLVKAIAAALAVLSGSGDAEIDPDTAAKGIRRIAHELLALPKEDRLEFIELIETIAEAEPESGAGYANFIRDIPRMIGIVESSC